MNGQPPQRQEKPETGIFVAVVMEGEQVWARFVPPAEGMDQTRLILGSVLTEALAMYVELRSAEEIARLKAEVERLRPKKTRRGKKGKGGKKKIEAEKKEEAEVLPPDVV